MYAFEALGVRLDADTIAAADAHVRAWREQVTVPLRALRTALKEGFAALPASAVEAARQKIKIAELEAESTAFAALAPFTGGTFAHGGDAAQADALLDAVVALYPVTSMMGHWATHLRVRQSARFLGRSAHLPQAQIEARASCRRQAHLRVDATLSVLQSRLRPGSRLSDRRALAPREAGDRGWGAHREVQAKGCAG